jgi:competence protein ComEA
MFRTMLSILMLCTVVTTLPCQAAAGQVPGNSGTATKPLAVVNINTATAKDLEGLPGIGQKTAARIVEFRQKNGPFKKIEDLMNIEGIGEKSFLRLKPLLTVAAKPEPAKQ